MKYAIGLIALCAVGLDFAYWADEPPPRRPSDLLVGQAIRYCDWASAAPGCSQISNWRCLKAQESALAVVKPIYEHSLHRLQDPEQMVLAYCTERANVPGFRATNFVDVECCLHEKGFTASR